MQVENPSPGLETTSVLFSAVALAVVIEAQALVVVVRNP